MFPFEHVHSVCPTRLQYDTNLCIEQKFFTLVWTELHRLELPHHITNSCNRRMCTWSVKEKICGVLENKGVKNPPWTGWDLPRKACWVHKISKKMQTYLMLLCSQTMFLQDLYPSTTSDIEQFINNWVDPVYCSDRSSLMLPLLPVWHVNLT